MAIKIEQRIVKVGIAGEKKPDAEPAASVVAPALPERPHAVNGTTYKVSAPGAYSASIYVTINDIDTPYGKRPIEIFIMSRAQESFQWITLVTRLASAVFRQQAMMPEYDSFVVQEFLATFDPGKQYYSSHYRGRFMNSVVQEIGMVLQDHLAGLGLMDATVPKAGTQPAEEVKHEPSKQPATKDQTSQPQEPTKERQGYSVEDVAVAAEASETIDEDELEKAAINRPQHDPCPECGSFNMQLLDGCMTCLDCGWSKCN